MSNGFRRICKLSSNINTGDIFTLPKCFCFMSARTLDLKALSVMKTSMTAVSVAV